MDEILGHWQRIAAPRTRYISIWRLSSMNLVFLNSATFDLDWIQEYYGNVFPDGAQLAEQKFASAFDLVLEYPNSGYLQSEFKNLRVYKVPKTPFSIVYRVSENAIEILRIIDSRGNPAEH